MATQTDKTADATREIGRRLRLARDGAGLTLAEIAAKAGISEGFLSKLERGQAAASIANLVQLTEALGLGLHELFDGDKAPAQTRITIHRAQPGKLHEVAATGYRWRHLGGGAPLDRMEAFHLVFPRRTRMATMVSHAGQEHCYVLSGEIRFFVGDEEHHLAAGDGIFIDSRLPHRAENAGSGQAQVLMTVAKQAEGGAAPRLIAPDWWQFPSFTAALEAEP